jgi:uncharacterized protein with ParB-like and HNH nuclease domain
MTDINPNQRVYDVMLALKNGTYRIPNIQRGYEWGQDRVLKLLDSIMSGYPIGAIMVWKPTDDIRNEIPTRTFVQSYDSTQDYLTEAPHPSNSDAYLVLDGQQRLQSLFISFFGSYNQKRVYLNLAQIPSDQDGDTDYGFEFLEVSETESRPEMVPLGKLISLDIDDEYEFVEALIEKLALDISNTQDKAQSATELRNSMNNNIRRFKNRFNERLVLLFQEVDKKHNYDHVLEIFERVNSAGMVLTKSDLMFSTLKLKLQEMEGKFAETLDFVNQGSRFNFNNDFLIKSSLVIFDQGAKYEVKKLRNDKFVQKVKSEFPKLGFSLRQLIAWLDDEARVKCDRFLRSRLALIPILDYMILSGNRDKPDGANSEVMKQYLYMAFFLRLFARAADSTLDQLHTLMRKHVKGKRDHFPIKAIRDFISNRQNAPFALMDYHFYNDADLILNIVDGGVLQIDPADPTRHPSDLRLEVDHIFPKSKLGKQGMSDIVNHLGNYRLVVRPINRRKGSVMPDTDTDFWGRGDRNIEPAYTEALSKLTRKSFRGFRDKRANAIKDSVKDFLQVEVLMSK